MSIIKKSACPWYIGGQCSACDTMDYCRYSTAENPDDLIAPISDEELDDDYMNGWYAGWDLAMTRVKAILQNNAGTSAEELLTHFPLHPAQPDEILEHEEWLAAQGVV